MIVFPDEVSGVVKTECFHGRVEFFLIQNQPDNTKYQQKSKFSAININ